MLLTPALEQIITMTVDNKQRKKRENKVITLSSLYYFYEASTLYLASSNSVGVLSRTASTTPAFADIAGIWSWRWSGQGAAPCLVKGVPVKPNVVGVGSGVS